MMNPDLYDALRAAHVDDGLARKAASSVADQPKEMREMDRQIADIRATLRLHGWMLTLSIAISVAILGRLLITPGVGG